MARSQKASHCGRESANQAFATPTSATAGVYQSGIPDKSTPAPGAVRWEPSLR